MSKNRVVLGVFTLGLLAAFVGGCQASANIGTGEPKSAVAAPPPPPPPAPEPPPAPPPPAEKPAIKAIGKAKIENNEIKIPGKIQFDTDKATIKDTPENKEILKTLADVMKENKQINKLRIEGHTDNKGAADHNQKLSQERAESVAEYLTKNGVEKDRLVTVGFGMNRPMAPNADDTAREKNRRTEFKLWEVDGKATEVQNFEAKLSANGGDKSTVKSVAPTGDKPATPKK